MYREIRNIYINAVKVKLANRQKSAFATLVAGNGLSQQARAVRNIKLRNIGDSSPRSRTVRCFNISRNLRGRSKADTRKPRRKAKRVAYLRVGDIAWRGKPLLIRGRN